MVSTKRAISELQERIIEIGNVQGTIDEVTARRFRADINRATVEGDPERYEFRGMIACLLGDAESTLLEFEKAMAIAPGDASLWANYLSSLNRLGIPYKQVSELVTQAHQRWNSEPSVLGALQPLYFNNAEFDKVRQIAEDAKRVYSNQPEALKYFDEIAMNAQTIEASGVDPAHFVEVERLAWQFIKQNGRIDQHYNRYMTDPDGGLLLEIVLLEVSDPKEVHELNQRFFNYLIDNGGDLDWMGDISVCLSGNYSVN